jgi:antitoxin component YwqK of YwqJK toxin-antitoxin module
MKKSLFFFLLLASGCMQRHFSTMAPGKLVSINLVDKNGLSETISTADRLKEYERVNFLSNQPYAKVLRVFSRDSLGNTKTYLTTYHPNGQPKQYLEAVNNRAYGQYREWHPEGTIKLEATLIGGEGDLSVSAEKTWLFDGVARVWSEKNNLMATIAYNKGVLQGPSLYYHPNGQIWKRMLYDKSQICGTLEIFLENGELFETIEYVSGKPHGKAHKYWSGGHIAAEEIYHNGLLSCGNYYGLDGKRISQVIEGKGQRAIFGKATLFELQEYRQGVLEGEVKTFSEDGSVLRISHIKDGVKHGEELEFFPPNPFNTQLRPMLSIHWLEGKIHGTVKTWYENGILESKREMANNVKAGLSTAWYRDGSLMMIEEYDQDKLVKGEYFKKGEKYPVSEVALGKGVATLYDGEGNFKHRINYHKGNPEDA